MKRIFEEADADGSGTINWKKFKDYVENDRVKAYLSTQQLEASDARTLFEMLKEGNDSEEIAVEQFIVGCQRLKGLAKSIDLAAVLQETRSMNRKMRVLVRKLDSTPGQGSVVSTRSASKSSWAG
uniref:EF-hand domain-containing protein n=1 Tax=Pyrodinium bahamense TaxID=73915 RepID=A0A7S0FPR2_9DINO|mmetsp:Transcript_39993/g.111134  ORF Transcript_39993/g.111134 Transcript_39993/m.111134 type:complete len:125 (+) Transcript_39993:2-376(+)